MGLLGGLLGGGLGGGLMRGGMMRGVGGGALGGLLAKRAMASRQGGGMPSGSGGGTQYTQTEEEQTQQEEEEPKPVPEGQPAPQAAEPRTQVPFADQQAVAMEKPVEKQQAAGPVTSTLMDEEGAVASKTPESPQSSVPPPPAFANQGGGTSPIAEKPSEEFGAQPMPQPQEGDLTDIREQAPRNFVEEQEAFAAQPLQFDQAAFPMAPVGGSVMPSSSSYAPRFTFNRR